MNDRRHEIAFDTSSNLISVGPRLQIIDRSKRRFECLHGLTLVAQLRVRQAEVV